jgi:Tfp pilus assembly protein PilX
VSESSPANVTDHDISVTFAETRIREAESTMRARAESARVAARSLPKDSPQAAALRGKAIGYTEAADLLAAATR